MTAEREVKLAASPDFRLPSFAGLGDGLVAEPRPVERLQTVYFDTADLRLARWGVSVRHRTGQGWTVKLPGERVGDLLVRGEHLFPGEDASTPPTEALDLLRAYVRTTTLRPAARLRSVRHGVDVRDEEGASLADVVYDEVSVLVGGRVEQRFREVEVEVPEETPPDLLDAILAALKGAGASVAAEPISKYRRAIGDRAAGPPEVVVPELPPKPTGGQAVRRAIANSVVFLLRSDAVVRLDEDVEGVHQARVATRRLRSDLRTFGPLLDREWTRELRDELRWLGDALGGARDTDVLLERLRGRVSQLPATELAGAAAAVEALERRDKEVHAALLEVIRSDRYVALLHRLVAAANGPALVPEADRPAIEVLPGLVRGPWGALAKKVRKAGKRPTDERLHDIRIRTKRLRYAAEAVAPVAGAKAQRFAKAAEGLQGVLGGHNDAVVAETWLRDWAVQAGSVDAAFAAGMLGGIERAAALEVRGTWRRAWRRLDDPRLRTWL